MFSFKLKGKLLKRILATLLLVFAICGITSCGLSRKAQFNSTDITKDIAMGNSIMGFNLFKVINSLSRGDNVLISPLSLSMIMSLLENGALDNTKKELVDFLQLSNISDDEINSFNDGLLNYYNSYNKKNNTVKIGNSIWVDKGFDVEKDFINLGKKYYDSTIKSLDFSKESSINTINSWVYKSTNGKIDKIVSEMDDKVKLLLINTLYMNSKWVKEFNKEKTYESTFQDNGQNVKLVDFMVNQSNFKYGKFEGYEMIQLPYEIDGLSMNILLPDKGVDVNSLISNFNNVKFESSLLGLEEKAVDLRLPKFKIEYENSLVDELKKLGVVESFTDKATFGKIAEGLYVSDVVQKTFIDVNEQGTEAAAATKVEMSKTSMPQYTIFDVNRPFVFAIYDDKTDEIMFLGKVETINKE